ncbi:MAG: SPOR domain-containing protein [Syntrophales bacterium]|nr:SPOR domain-containing protein [Syntrophales bacterium]
MDTDNKTDEEILDELENIYQRVAEEDVGNISSDDLNELSETEPEEQPGKKPSALAFHGTLFLAVCLFVGIVLAVFIRYTGTPDSKPTVKTPTYRIPITIPPASPKADVKTPSKTETEKVVAAIPGTNKETPPAPVKKEEAENRKEIEPATEKPYTIQISAIRNFEIAKDFLRKISVSQPDVHWDRLNSKKYGVWCRVFIGHFASRTEALRYMKEKNIRNTYPGSYILTIPASPPKR